METEPLGQQAKPAGTRKVSPLLLAFGIAVPLLVAISYGGCLGDLLAPSEERSVEAVQVIEKFMYRMAARKPELVEQLFARSLPRAELRSAIQSMADDKNYVLFAGYEGVVLGAAQSQVYQGCTSRTHHLDVNGRVNYREGEPGTFVARLLREDGVWTLVGINVNVPPSRIPQP